MSIFNLKAGDKVRVVHAKGYALDATVDAVLSSVLLNITFDDAAAAGSVDGNPVRITLCRYDREGKKPDSWHFAEPAAEPAKA